jgi:outer membrane protein OmpA-like peptidoglycan-associated protein
MASLLPIVAGVLRREAMARNLDANGVAQMLHAQRGIVGGYDAVSPRSAEYDRDVSISSAPFLGREGQRRGGGIGKWIALAAGAFLLGTLLFLCGRRPDLSKVSMPDVPKVETPKITTPETPPLPVVPIPEPAAETTITRGEIEKTGAPKTGGDLSTHFAGGKLPDRFALEGVRFRFGSAEIAPGSETSIDALAAAMMNHPSSTVKLEGHTDNVGNKDVNTQLSYARAAAVRKELMDRGIDGQRIQNGGKRDLDPVESNDTVDGRSKNRRVDVVVMSR